MATSKTSVFSVYNAVPQPLYTITDPLDNGVPQFVAGENSAVVTFDNESGDRGSDISIDGATGIISLTGEIAYTITARVNTTCRTPVVFSLVETSSGYAFATPTPAGETLTIVVTPADANDYQIVARTVDGSRFQYPDALTNANVTVQAVYGYTL